jgi:hypothetical protein
MMVKKQTCCYLFQIGNRKSYKNDYSRVNSISFFTRTQRIYTYRFKLDPRLTTSGKHFSGVYYFDHKKILAYTSTSHSKSSVDPEIYSQKHRQESNLLLSLPH